MRTERVEALRGFHDGRQRRTAGELWDCEVGLAKRLLGHGLIRRLEAKATAGEYEDKAAAPQVEGQAAELEEEGLAPPEFMPDVPPEDL